MDFAQLSTREQAAEVLLGLNRLEVNKGGCRKVFKNPSTPPPMARKGRFLPCPFSSL